MRLESENSLIYLIIMPPPKPANKHVVNTDADLKDEKQKAGRCKTDVLVVSLYYDLLEILTDEDINPKECIAFEKECQSFLNKNGIEF